MRYYVAPYLLCAALHLLANAQEPQAGWPVSVMSPSEGPYQIHTMSLGNMDTDAQMEVFAFTLTGCGSWLFDGTGSQIESWEVTPLTPDCQNNQEFLHVGDITGDAVAEVIFLGSAEAHSVFALDTNGQAVPGWPVTVGGPDAYGHNIGRIVLADIAGDSALEVIVQDRHIIDRVEDYSTRLYVYDGQGNVLPGWPVSFPLSVVGLAVGDLEFDGIPEIVVSTAHATDPWDGPQPIYVLNANGVVRDGWPVLIDDEDAPGVLINITLADLDGDYSCEILGAGPDAFYILDASGNRLLTLYDKQFVIPPAVGDLDGNGTLEVLVPDLGLAVVDINYGIVAQISALADYVYYDGITIGDLDGDGVCEIGARSFDPPAMHWFNSELESLPGWPKPIAPGAASPARFITGLTDLDGDGDLESIFPNWLQLEAWSFPNPNGPTRLEWGHYYHDPQRTGFYHLGRYPGPRFLRGDVDKDGSIHFLDAIQALRYLTGELAHNCPARIDFNADSRVDLCDALGHLQYSFLGGPAPPAPFPTCREVLNELLPCAHEACP